MRLTMRPLLAGIALGTLVCTGSFLQTSAVAQNSPSTPTRPIRRRAQVIPTQIPRTPNSSPQSTNTLTVLEQSVHAQINQHRTSRGLPPLTLDTRISEQARSHSQAMASGRVPFSHQGFDQRVQAIAKFMSYRGAAENVGYNQGYADPDRQAVQGWLNSTGHRNNIEGQYTSTGIGVAQNAKGEYYFTQIFIR